MASDAESTLRNIAGMETQVAPRGPEPDGKVSRMAMGVVASAERLLAAREAQSSYSDDLIIRFFNSKSDQSSLSVQDIKYRAEIEADNCFAGSVVDYFNFISSHPSVDPYSTLIETVFTRPQAVPVGLAIVDVLRLEPVKDNLKMVSRDMKITSEENRSVHFLREMMIYAYRTGQEKNFAGIVDAIIDGGKSPVICDLALEDFLVSTDLPESLVLPGTNQQVIMKMVNRIPDRLEEKFRGLENDYRKWLYLLLEKGPEPTTNLSEYARAAGNWGRALSELSERRRGYEIFQRVAGGKIYQADLGISTEKLWEDRRALTSHASALREILDPQKVISERDVDAALGPFLSHQKLASDRVEETKGVAKSWCGDYRPSNVPYYLEREPGAYWKNRLEATTETIKAIKEMVAGKRIIPAVQRR